MDNKAYEIRDRFFREDHMYARMEEFAKKDNLTVTLKALEYMAKKHEGQFRQRGILPGDKVKYINHPLLMARHAYSLGIRDDNLLAAILIHDVVEDTDTLLEELPFDGEIKEIVELVTFSICKGKTKQESKDIYFERMKSNERAMVVKIIDRCNNVSTMAGAFDRDRLLRYIVETEKYVLPYCDILKEQSKDYKDIAFIIKYHMISVLESIKCMME